jgi:phosphatidate cytidylyltransferase
MLKTRVVTAITVVLVLLVALFYFPAWAWGLFTCVIVLAGCWEWSRFCGFSKRGGIIYLLCSAVLACAFLAVYVLNPPGDWLLRIAQALFVLAGVFWLLAVPIWLKSLWNPKHAWICGVAGWLVMFPTWSAFLLMRNISPLLLLSLMAVVWAADIAAYFAGKRFGQAKLAPAISPGKTWEGAVGGLIGVMCYFLIWLALLWYAGGAGWARGLLLFGNWLPLLFLALGATSILGDLFESWMKRRVGMKDSSNLLPGHGGILDRIDALTATLPVAGLFLFFVPK